ncbi:short-chain dehydrogenase/reductase SDR [Clostridium sp. DL-VIII]|uniref:SDR family NAD(P)-dependent oxidoreductase n=1 Tax=Clostridium sp. DL-VIII TaxID=641107 RepID=UPI00023AF0EE|nr:SDR family NAD(P)-dependent oxidoreductase [Clostridium sp. DL-VIII]EHI97003.1 short-chain dehydrogenase/reductase SDR [Clostridium sp. DL-VIII]
MNNLSRYTLITGGSEGIGFELAKLFAADKNNLIIAARNKYKLENIKNSLEKEYGIRVEVIECDLSVDKACEKIIEFVEEKNFIVDNLINNAGVGSFGFFHESENGFEEKLINVNIISLTVLTRYFIKDMVSRKEGGILNVASTAAFIGGPKMAIYYSSKAYVLSLTEALHDEVKSLGVRVSCLCPGPVKTSFQEKSGIKKSEVSKKYLMDASIVAKEAYLKFLKGKVIIIPGRKNKLLIFLNKLIPRALGRWIILKNNN